MKETREELIAVLITLFNNKGLPVASHGELYQHC